MNVLSKRNVLGRFYGFVLTLLCLCLGMGAAQAQDGSSNITVSITNPQPMPTSIAVNSTIYVGLSASLDSPPKSTDECTTGKPRNWSGTTYSWSTTVGTFVDSNGSPTTPTGTTARLALSFSKTGTQSATVSVSSSTSSSCGTLSGSGSKTISVQAVGVKSVSGSPGSLSNGTLYVAQGTTVTFTATADGGSWPSGMPVWGGAASGTGPTTTVTFNTVSSSASSPFTVTATCGNSTSLSVIVYKLSISPPSGQNVLVGQIVNLSASVAPSDLTVSNYQWSIRGTIAHDWTHSDGVSNGLSNASAFMWPIGSGQLSSPSLSFAWVDGGSSRNVSLSVQLNAASVSTSSTFNVTNPNYSFSLTTGDPVSIFYNNKKSQMVIGAGTVGNGLSHTGVQLSMIGAPSSDIPNCSYYQIVNSSYTKWHTTPTSDNLTGWLHEIVYSLADGNNPSLILDPITGSQILDTLGPYPQDFPGIMDDSPDVGLDADNDQVSNGDSFSDYLMYRPSASSWLEHTQSIWVPMATASWSWAGSATRHGTSWVSGDLTSATNPVATSSNSTTTYPTWSWNIFYRRAANGQGQ